MVKADAMVESETVLSDTDYHEGNEVVVKQMSNIEAPTYLKALFCSKSNLPTKYLLQMS